MRFINEVIIHCSATRPEWMFDKTTEAKVAEIRRWHVSDRGWSDIGYHIICDRNGRIVPGRPIEKAGAHTLNHNANSIGVCLIGGHGSSSRDKAEQHFTEAQLAALRTVLADLQVRFPTIRKVSGHNEYAAKACPGFHVGEWLASQPRVAGVAGVARDAKWHETQPSAPNVTQTGWLAAIIAAIVALFRKG